MGNAFDKYLDDNRKQTSIAEKLCTHGGKEFISENGKRYKILFSKNSVKRIYCKLKTMDEKDFEKLPDEFELHYNVNRNKFVSKMLPLKIREPVVSFLKTQIDIFLGE